MIHYIYSSKKNEYEEDIRLTSFNVWVITLLDVKGYFSIILSLRVNEECVTKC